MFPITDLITKYNVGINHPGVSHWGRACTTKARFLLQRPGLGSCPWSIASCPPLSHIPSCLSLSHKNAEINKKNKERNLIP